MILYEALSGVRPYEANNPTDLLIRMATESPAPLLERAPNVDPALARVVMQALARDPAARPRDVASFAAALDRLGAEAPRARRLWAVPWLVLAVVALLAVAYYARPILAPSHARGPAHEVSPRPPAPVDAAAAAPVERAEEPLRAEPMASSPSPIETAAPRRRGRSKSTRRDEHLEVAPADAPPQPARVLELRPADF